MKNDNEFKPILVDQSNLTIFIKAHHINLICRHHLCCSKLLRIED